MDHKCTKCEKPHTTAGAKTLHERSCKVVKPEVTKEDKPAADTPAEAPKKVTYYPNTGYAGGPFERP